VSTGLIVHVTGAPASGKTTFAEALVRRLRWLGRAAEVLDGDAVRRDLFPEIDFTESGRREAVTRTHRVARLLARNGVVAVVAMVSPHAAVRREVREEAERAGLGFAMVHVHASPETIAERVAARGGEVDPRRTMGCPPAAQWGADADFSFECDDRTGAVAGWERMMDYHVEVFLSAMLGTVSR
jgi:predicted kinase